MKKITILAAIAMIAFSSKGFAQAEASATASSSATIITPIAITNATDLNFGEIAVSATVPGTVDFSTTGVLTSTGGVTLPTDATVTTSAPSFTVTGQEDYTYAVEIPATITLSHAITTTETMTVTLSEAATGTLTLGTETFYVGASLAVPAGKTDGVYNNTSDLKVTVYYN